MTLANQNDGNSQGPAGAAEQSTSQVSGNESQPLPGYVEELRTQNAQLLEQVSELGTQVKGLQKGTDKQIGQMRNDVKRILELKEQGLDESQIKRELFLDSLMDGQNTQQPTAPDTRQQAPTFDVEATLKSLQFGENDPGLAALKVKYGNDPQKLLTAAADLRISQLQTPNPSGATGPSPQGNASDEATQGTLQAEWNKRIGEIAQTMSGDAKTRAIANLRVEMRGKGLTNV